MPQWPRDKSSISSLLNDPAPGSGLSRALTHVQHRLVVDHAYSASLLESLVEETSGCSVEQLEQIHSAMMNEIWRTRDQWDRIRVARKVSGVLSDVLEDIRVCQGTAARSMEIED